MFTKNLLDKRKKMEPNFQVNNLVRTADLRKTISKRDTTNWPFKLYEVTEIISVTIPSYRNDNLSERHNETLLKKTELTLKKYIDVMKALDLI